MRTVVLRHADGNSEGMPLQTCEHITSDRVIRTLTSLSDEDSNGISGESPPAAWNDRWMLSVCVCVRSSLNGLLTVGAPLLSTLASVVRASTFTSANCGLWRRRANASPTPIGFFDETSRTTSKGGGYQQWQEALACLRALTVS